MGAGAARFDMAMVAAMLLLAGCSKASLLGGPGPQAAHHASPASSERTAELVAMRKFKTVEACHAQLIALAHLDGPDRLIRISDLEVRGYHSAGQGAATVHHEYSCFGAQMMERSWADADPSPHSPTDIEGGN